MTGARYAIVLCGTALLCSFGQAADDCAPGAGTASAGCCADCGCRTGVTKVCRRVPEQKKVSVTCWGCKEDDFCIPGASTPNCEHCEDVCRPNDGCCLHGCTRSFVWTEWLPSNCAKIFTKKKLMKRTITKTVPSYKWVVEELCPACCEKTRL